MNLAGQVVLITGASDGIGACCARAFRAAGARLSLTGRSEAKLARVAAQDDFTIACDLTGTGTAAQIIERTIARFGRLDVLINNAGSGIYWPVSTSPDASNRATFDLNVFAPLALMQAAIPVMRAQGSGTIVNVSSIAGRVALPWMPVYSASKAALDSLTESLRMELASSGIRVVLVSPGYILTSFHEHATGIAPPPRVVEGKRFAITPEQCAQAIVRGVERGSRMVLTPRWGWFLIAMHRFLPRLVEAHLVQLNRSAERV